MKTAFLFLILLLTTHLFAQPLTPAQRSAIDGLVMADIPDGGPGAAVGIVRNGEVVYEKYAGLADIKAGRPITAATRFNLASNAKQFTSVRALQLIGVGKLRLDDDIRRYLPELYPDLATPITVRHLINHTSGLRDVYDLWGIQGNTWWKKKYTNADALELLRGQRDLNFTPGSEHLYSNSNYIVLAEIIASISGVSFKEDMDNFFADLGMPATSFRDDAKTIIPEMAEPYFNFNKWVTYELPATTHGDGALFSNLRDQLNWEASLQTGNSSTLTRAQLRRSQLPLDTVTGYAYGLENGTYRSTPVRYHDGSTGAWKASTLRFPGQQLTIVVLNNSGKFGTNPLARQIADELLFPDAEKTRFPTGPDKITSRPVEADILGAYVINDFYYYRYVKRDGQLFLERPNREPVAIEWEEGNVFHEINDPAFKQAFTTTTEGENIVTAYYPSHDPYSLTQIDPDWTTYNFSALAGTFYNEELDVTAKVKWRGGRNFRIKAGGNAANADLVVPDILTFNGSPLRVQRDKAGAVTGFSYSDGRVRNLIFKRVK